MTDILRWTQARVAVLLAVAMFALPALSVARDRCDDRRSSRQTYNARNDYRNAGYVGNRRNSGYRNNQYRNSAYRNNSYGNSQYGYREGGYYSDGDYRATRSTGKSAAIIAGSAAAGAAIGGLTAGGKGAAIGAAIGGVGGLIYDRKTRNNGDRWGW